MSKIETKRKNDFLEFFIQNHATFEEERQLKLLFSNINDHERIHFVENAEPCPTFMIFRKKNNPFLYCDREEPLESFDEFLTYTKYDFNQIYISVDFPDKTNYLEYITAMDHNPYCPTEISLRKKADEVFWEMKKEKRHQRLEEELKTAFSMGDTMSYLQLRGQMEYSKSLIKHSQDMSNEFNKSKIKPWP